MWGEPPGLQPTSRSAPWDGTSPLTVHYYFVTFYCRRFTHWYCGEQRVFRARGSKRSSPAHRSFPGPHAGWATGRSPADQEVHPTKAITKTHVSVRLQPVPSTMIRDVLPSSFTSLVLRRSSSVLDVAALRKSAGSSLLLGDLSQLWQSIRNTGSAA